MAKPLLGYLSMLRLSTSTVTDPGSATGYPITNLYDMKSYTVWTSNTTVKPINIDIDTGAGGANADYIALVNSNLTTLGATIKVMGDGASPATTERLAATACPSDDVVYLPFTAPGAVRYWRIQITVAGASFASAPSIGDLYMGMKTELPEYLPPSVDPFFSGVEVAGSRSEGGHALGAVTRGHSHRGVIRSGAAGAARAAWTSDLIAFRAHAEKRQPFFFVVDTGDTDFDSPYFIRMTDDGRFGVAAVGGSYSRFAYDIPVTEAYMEPVA